MSRKSPGIGFQLQAIRNNLEGTIAAAEQQFDVACTLVRHGHEEPGAASQLCAQNRLIQ